jgi:hypothetical protein
MRASRILPLAVFVPLAWIVAAGCKSQPAATAPAAVPTSTLEVAFPPKPRVKPPAFKVFDERESIFTLVTKPDATDDEVASIIWELRDGAHARTLDTLKVSQKIVDDRKPLVWFHIYRGIKCATEKYTNGPLPCGNRYNGAGDYTYGGYTNHDADIGVIRDGDKETRLWDPDKAYVKGS